MLFIYGLPAEISRSGADCLGFGKDPKEQAKARFYDRMAYVALVCLVSGFVLQGVSNWL